MELAIIVGYKDNDEFYDLPQVNIGDVIDGEWGYGELILSPRNLKHLLTGGALYVSNGEFANTIRLGDEALEYASKILQNRLT